MKTKNLAAVLFFFISVAAFAQTARIKGVILDENNQPVEDADISYKNTSATSNKNGFYILTVPANQKITIIFSHLSNKSASLDIELKPNEDFEFNPVLSKKIEMIGVVEIYDNRKRIEGITNISPRDIKLIPGANAGVENLLKTLPGVNNNSDLSSGYNVRGGNYDENLVYVNEVEVYRPFLIRSGQQEGLSFTNTDMIQNVDFSAGGFQAKYGDKLSSVLDITYRRPKSFGASLEASLLGGSLMVETASKNQKWAAITGVRYRDNSLLVNSQETETNFRPTFADIQTNVTFNPNNKWEWSFLGNISQNRYNYEPLTRQTNFGTIDDPKALLVFYEGQEKDRYETYFGALKTTYKASEDFTLKFIASAYLTQEQEYFDIKADYSFGELDTNIGSGSLGNIVYTQEIGSQLNHARNDLDALIVNAEVKGFHNIKENKIEWGFKYTREDIRDRIVEWEVIDSAGFSLNPPVIDLPIRDQPYTPYTGPLVPYQNVRALNFTKIDRLSGYVQWSKKSLIGSHDVWYNFGVRAHNWQVSGDNLDGKNQTTFSPRGQFAIKPDWDSDMVFRLSGGLYHQPPFYRELRGADGKVNPDVKAQQSIHVVLSNDYSFQMWQRPFKLVTEAYYKSMSDVNTYTLDNVRIRYSANNDAKAYAAGFDARLNGEFVPGTESWFSFGYMKTEENINNRGYIARPTDQRLKFGILFQDYVKNIPNLKLYLNLVYNTGLPGGSPSYADPYVYQSRLRDYRRADVGFSYVFTEKNELRPDGHWLKRFKDLSLGFEIFNMFNNQNAITNTWVRDVYTKVQYGIPNYMTTRVFNVKLTARL
ncbi:MULTISPECIES: carboxypeptidase-like regulatory domain-containing protein [Flavobacterium]|uniref:TonB-dependent receptor n=1 Tax=Flavobacterium TaxID=237 RepID=UPI0006F6E0B9|nr:MULTISPECIES: carboxypeptidase-like regulatory domain-containing protein [Flavobacterium]KQS48563.1 TonB-dependent receptor [Flavobacterium sp. Leaf359]MDQ7961843.1 TonB-dependent receptor plug domain-containing protein [Flavobacterium lindanitolerans]PZO34643.1 MAG: TonB-dependent receptor [Flavobacteriaceae bacterium]THD30758.1 MAG: TonB-dependent receptor [Flavobacterium johnsoniae]